MVDSVRFNRLATQRMDSPAAKLRDISSRSARDSAKRARRLAGGRMPAGAAVGGAAGSIASQAVGIAIGEQDGFNWKGVALSARMAFWGDAFFRGYVITYYVKNAH